MKKLIAITTLGLCTSGFALAGTFTAPVQLDFYTPTSVKPQVQSLLVNYQYWTGQYGGKSTVDTQSPQHILDLSSLPAGTQVAYTFTGQSIQEGDPIFTRDNYPIPGMPDFLTPPHNPLCNLDTVKAGHSYKITISLEPAFSASKPSSKMGYYLDCSIAIER